HTRVRRATVVMFTAALTACAPTSTQMRTQPLYGWVVDHTEDPYGQSINIVIPPNAPSIQARYRPAPVPTEQGNFLGVHAGIDISGNIGDPIIAAAAGTVVVSKSSRVWGNMVRIDHGPDENGRDVQTLYVHLDKRLVESNARVQRGQQIGTMGITGLTAGNPTHLHYVVYTAPHRELSGKWQSANPHLYWADGIGIVTCYDPSRYVPEQPLRMTYPVPCR
ncbi:MAG: M23 family metallopeptidase, partial [Gammaproteobacteria bacterium]|nr:M23 family metallopeptidase [Gammaproteobacteria bacterium]